MSGKDVIVIGAGAAGLLCAIEAGKRGRRVLIIDHADKVGKKILISGGGRCNFTNAFAAPENYISANPNFCKSALARYTPNDFIALVEKHGIRYHEKKLGQLFCDTSAREIVRMLLDECAAARVELLTSCRVRSVVKNDESSAGRFTVETNRGTFHAASLVVATGGLSIPKIGATDFGYRLARQFGLRITPLRPALVPFTMTSQTAGGGWLSELSGVSFSANVSCHQARFEENVLITHRGLSGPAILQISSYWKEGDYISIDLLPRFDVEALIDTLQSRASESIELSTVLSQHLPTRFARAWCQIFARSQVVNRFTPKELVALAEQLKDWRIIPHGTEGYAKAEVTCGGVSTVELSSKTMECERVAGLYFIGEVVDVTGWLGGYNFQWAWASGYAAGQYV